MPWRTNVGQLPGSIRRRVATNMILAHATLIAPQGLIPGGWVSFSSEGLIAEVGLGTPPADPVTIDLRGAFLAPGFVDLHIHGALQRDTMEATEEAFANIAGYHASGGTTSLLLTTITARLDSIAAVLETARRFPNTHAGARVLGIHVEGPFFSPEKPGAHDVSLLHPPTDPEETALLLEYADVVRQLTIAPELPGALSFMDRARERGVIVSGGHSNCWAEEAEAARAHGMTQVTHTYNCMSSARRRGVFREAGLLEYALSEPDLACELIADGRHVSPTLMRALYQAKGPDKIQLVTDATGGAGLAEGTRYALGKIDCLVKDGVGMLADGSAIAGSTCRMIDGVRQLVEVVGLPLQEAVQMATYNPARALGREAEIGVLSKGARADFVIFSEYFEVKQTWVGGQIVFEA